MVKKKDTKEPQNCLNLRLSQGPPFRLYPDTLAPVPHSGRSKDGRCPETQVCLRSLRRGRGPVSLCTVRHYLTGFTVRLDVQRGPLLLIRSHYTIVRVLF